MADSHEYITSLDDVKIGKNVLESLTRSAYDDCRCILREYVQNAADQIDIAREQNLSEEDNYAIYIQIDPDAKRIEIEDNATGVKANEILPVLRDVACSQKQRETRKGFRGIGRLGGLGYCSTLTFVTSYKGENVRSILSWDAEKMTRLIDDQNDASSASDVVAAVTKLSSEPEEVDAHYFKVVMENVTDERLLYIEDIRAYLSMVAPVDINNSFMPFRNEILNFAKTNNLRVDTYDIFVNKDPIYKPYTRTLVDKSGTLVDEIKKIEFFYQKDSNGDPLYWGWYSIRKNFDCAIDPRNIARGMRLRCKNIQLGSDTNCRRFLPGKQDERFSDYYYGEIHTLSDQLIPDMDRNYLRVDDKRTEFEEVITRTTFRQLKDLCYTASQFKSDYNKIKKYHDKENEINNKKKKSQFNSQEEFQKETDELKKLREEAKKSQDSLERKQNCPQNHLLLVESLTTLTIRTIFYFQHQTPLLQKSLMQLFPIRSPKPQ